MFEIFKRNKKEEQEEILKRAMKDTINPSRIGIGLSTFLEFCLMISWLIRYGINGNENVIFFIFYAVFVVFGCIVLFVQEFLFKDIEHNYKKLRILQSVMFLTLIIWATLLTTFEAKNGSYFSYIIYATFAVAMPMIFYIDRYFEFGTLIVSQVAIILHFLYALHLDFFNNTINFAVFCIFDIIAAISFGYTKMISIKREIAVDKLSNRDALTELYNRQKLNKDSSEILELNLNNHYELTAIMMDIDDFKMINDNFGHKKGDDVISSVSKIIKKETLKRNGHVYRYGGEEFLILASNMSRNQGVNLVEAIMKGLREMKIEGIIKPVTLSFGIYTKIPTLEDNIESYYEKADELLYISKKNGKNQYTFNGRDCNNK